jgi:uncharacterized protein YjbJ (UPF0337 family)
VLEGAAKKVEGKVENAWGQAKDAVKKPATDKASNEREREKKRAVNE